MCFGSKAADKSLKKQRLKQGGESQRMFQMSFHWNVVGVKDKWKANIKIQIWKAWQKNIIQNICHPDSGFDPGWKGEWVKKSI